MGSARQVKRKDIHAGRQVPKLLQEPEWGTLSTGTGNGPCSPAGFQLHGFAFPAITACPWPRTHTCRVNKHQDDALRDTWPISADSGYSPASWAPQQERGSWPHPLLPVQLSSQPSYLTAALQKAKLSFAVSSLLKGVWTSDVIRGRGEDITHRIWFCSEGWCVATQPLPASTKGEK